jgi:hypothetical protein
MLDPLYRANLNDYNTEKWTKSKLVVILGVIHHHQNTLVPHTCEFVKNHVWLFFLIIGLCILLRVYQSIYIEISVRNKCRCSFYCALLTLHVSAPIGGHLQVVL